MPRGKWPTFWERLDDSPPILVRLTARRQDGPRNRRAFSHAELAIACGMSIGRIVEISHLFDWEAVTIGEARTFMAACRFDPTSRACRRMQYDYTKKCTRTRPHQPPHFLRASPYWETEFLPLLDHLRKHHPKSSAASGASASPEMKRVA